MTIKRKDSLTIYRDEHDEDGLDMEETQFPYYDDNWDLTGYTSKLTRNDNGKFFAFIDFNADGSEGKIRECPHCLKYELHNKLGAKIKKKGEPSAPDDQLYLSCYDCGNTFPIHETFTESKIKDSVETTDNPFENESVFLSTDSRATERRKGKKRKGRFAHKQEHEDPEIQAEINKGNTVRIIQDY